MREGKPSRTAVWVAWGRGMAGKAKGAIVDDPIAEQLVPQPFRGLIALARRSPAFIAGAERGVALLSGGRSRHIPLRTRAIDDALLDSVRGGTSQFVILGAGLDARAWRLDALSEAIVYEVDHPTMQAYKRARVDRLPPRARDVRFVSVDLERDDLAASLAAAGHDATRPTTFVWEGVTMYLTPEALDATLSAIAARSASGSALIATYFVRATPSAIERALLPVLTLVGEPIRSSFVASEMAALLSRHGFGVRSDEGDVEWSDRYLGRRQPASMERLVVADR